VTTSSIPSEHTADGLTDRQREYLGIVRRLYANQGFFPPVSQIQGEVGCVSSNSVVFALKELVKRGYLRSVEHPAGSGRHKYLLPESERPMPDVLPPTIDQMTAALAWDSRRRQAVRQLPTDVLSRMLADVSDELIRRRQSAASRPVPEVQVIEGRIVAAPSSGE
jgi:hypothetical protein